MLRATDKEVAASTLHGGPQDDLADLDIGRLLDRECHRTCHRLRCEAEFVHIGPYPGAQHRIVYRTVELRTDKSR